MSHSKIICLFVSVVCLGCAQTRNGFVPCNDVSERFFGRLADISAQKPTNGMKFSRIDSVRVFETIFEEKERVSGNVLERSELPEGSTKGSDFLNGSGYSQRISLFQLFTDNLGSNAFVFFSVKFDAAHQSIGFGPSYFGRYEAERKRIRFFRLLKPINNDQTFTLQKKRGFVNLYFFFSRPGSGFGDSDFPTKLETVVDSTFNKIGGNKPFVISIEQLFHDPAAFRFHYVKTLYFPPKKDIK